MPTIDALVAQLRTEAANAQALFARTVRQELHSVIDSVLAKYTGQTKGPSVALPKTEGTGAPAKSAKRTRVIVTPEMKAKVKSMVKAGKSGGEIAKETGASLPTVQNIKKALGLVQARKK